MKRSRSSDNKIEFYHLLFRRSQVRSMPVRSDDTPMRSLMRCDDREHLLLCSRALKLALQETDSEMRCYDREHLLLCSRASAVTIASICCYDREHLLLRSRAGTLALQETYYYSDACGNDINYEKERNLQKKWCVNKRVTHPKTNIENVLSLASGTYC
jgi:hypothetical protein